MTAPNTTKQKILDAAELLFAGSGYHATTLRAITAKAGVNLAAVNYHFGSKEALLEAVFERRLVPLNEKRMAMLRAVREAAGERGERPRVEEIMRAFVEPTIRFRDSDPGARNFILLMSSSITEPTGKVRKGLHRFMGPFFKAMIESLREALPGIPEELIIQKFHFALGSLIHTILVSEREFLPVNPGLLGRPDPESVVKGLVRFITAGMEAR